jgi:methyl-accepting chemotaxis protein
MAEAPDRRNPLRLIVSKETQLHILGLVASGIFFSVAAVLTIAFWLKSWLWTGVLAAALGVFVSLWVSRLIAGPFYRIEKDLEVIVSNGTQRRQIQLRPGDPLQHLADLVNQLIEKARR